MMNLEEKSLANVITMIINDLKNHNLHYALDTLSRHSLKNHEFKRVVEILIDEFFKRKKSILEWEDGDFRGVETILASPHYTFEIKRKVFEFLLDQYREIESDVADDIARVTSRKEVGKWARGLLILAKTWQVLRPHIHIEKTELEFPKIDPPKPEPDANMVNEVLSLLEESHQIILMGPPGTGKTHLSMWVAHKLTKERKQGEWIFVQFHPSYRYEDFIERLVFKSTSAEGVLSIVPEPQLFVRICEVAKQNPDEIYVLVLDEINRANVSEVFGELIYAVEYRGYPVKLAYSSKELIVPENVYIIGTANNIDRGTFDIGVALRRRFKVYQLEPDEKILQELLKNNGVDDNTLSLSIEIFRGVNNLFERAMGRKGLGQFFFKEVHDKESLKRVWLYSIKHLITTYFSGPMLIEQANSLIGNIERKIGLR